MFKEVMSIEINSFEYQCWHEVGHAVTCLHLGGDVAFIEFIDDETHKGLARARCETTPDIRPLVLCGGFATEFVLSRDGYLENHDEREFTQIVFKNASIDREMFFGKTEDDDLTKKEDTEFMHLAVDCVAPIIRLYLSEMSEIVGHLKTEKKVDGSKIKSIMQKT